MTTRDHHFTEAASTPPLASGAPCGEEITGVHKNTVARGPGAFPRSQARISDCHDATIYALAPLDCISISCCSDCVVVVGAVGKLIRVERCVRLQLIAVCRRIYINASHDCIFYLGTNHPPVLLGDNRFVQVWGTWAHLFLFSSHVHRAHSLHRTTASMSSFPSTWQQPGCSLWSIIGTSRWCCCTMRLPRTWSNTSPQTAKAQSCVVSQRLHTPSCRRRNLCHLSSPSRAGQGRCVGGRRQPLHSHGAVCSYVRPTHYCRGHTTHTHIVTLTVGLTVLMQRCRLGWTGWCPARCSPCPQSMQQQCSKSKSL